MAQQEKYEAEMRSLSASISEAQEQLLGSPIQASSVDDLKHQIAERNVSLDIIVSAYMMLNTEDAVLLFTCAQARIV